MFNMARPECQTYIYMYIQKENLLCIDYELFYGKYCYNIELEFEKKQICYIAPPYLCFRNS